MSNQYKKLSSNEWGAWIDTGYGRTAIAKPQAGDTVTIITKAGEQHERIIKSIIKDYASGVIVSLEADEEVAQSAAERYADAKKPTLRKKAEAATLNRQQINALFDRAEMLRDSPGDYFPALAKAESALALWQKENPSDAAEENRQKLLAAAAAEERKASDALTFDADGWLDGDERERRAKKHLDRAVNLKKEAKNA